MDYPSDKPSIDWGLAHFGVMLCQASFFVRVEYHKSTLPQQKIRSPRLTPNCIQYLIAQTETVASIGEFSQFGVMRRRQTRKANFPDRSGLYMALDLRNKRSLPKFHAKRSHYLQEGRTFFLLFSIVKRKNTAG